MIPRRRIIEGFLLSTAGLPLIGPSWAAESAALPQTPAQTPGPFYPDVLPRGAGNDLIQIAGHSEQAKGVVAHIAGHVLGPTGRPISGARVEIWQCDANGRYHHVRDTRAVRPLDENFLGYGQTTTDQSGGYRFRTIRPVPYPGRTPHIHFAVSAPGLPRFVTQMYVAGEPGNERDGILAGVRDPAARARLIVALTPASDAEPNAVAGSFEIVPG